MSLEAVTWALSQDRIHSPDKFVLLAVADAAGAHNIWIRDIPAVSSFTNMTGEAIETSLARLTDGRFLIRDPSTGGYFLPVPIPESPSESYRKRAIPKALRSAVFHRDGHACLRCGSEDDLTADHVVPEIQGGPTTAKNLQTLCRLCNLSKGTKTVDYRRCAA